MTTFTDANQVRVALKMKLSNYSWYNWCVTTNTGTSDGYEILVNVKRLDNSVRKVIPPVINGVEVKVESES